VQQRQFPPFDFEKLTHAEQRALRASARRTRSLVASVGAGMLALLAIGCPEPGDLQNPGAYPAPAPAPVGGSAAAAGSGTGGGAANGSECESACMAAIIKATCKTCHGTAAKLGGTLDMESAGYTARLKDHPSEHAAVASDAMCPTGDKLVDTMKPAESWLLKKVMSQQGTCGTPMPVGAALSTADQMCFQTYVSCVAPGGAAPSGGTASGGTASGGTASGGTATGGSGGTGGT
jgi:hypothetical protein